MRVLVQLKNHSIVFGVVKHGQSEGMISKRLKGYYKIPFYHPPYRTLPWLSLNPIVSFIRFRFSPFVCFKSLRVFVSVLSSAIKNS